MRRRPIAVYRVIDEEELLGGEGIGLSGAAGDPPLQPLPADGVPVRPAAWRERSASRRGWASTAVAVVALGGVAVLLLGISAHARAPVAASDASPRIPSKRPTRGIRRPDPAVASGRAQATRPATRPGRLRTGRRTRPPKRLAKSAVTVRRPASSAPASRPSGAPGQAADAQPVPDQEFGFER